MQYNTLHKNIFCTRIYTPSKYLIRYSIRYYLVVRCPLKPNTLWYSVPKYQYFFSVYFVPDKCWILRTKILCTKCYILVHCGAKTNEVWYSATKYKYIISFSIYILCQWLIKYSAPKWFLPNTSCALLCYALWGEAKCGGGNIPSSEAQAGVSRPH